MKFADTRISKKAKIDDSTAAAKESNDITTLTIHENTNLKKIANYKYLSVLKLVKTNIENIEACPNLHILSILDNDNFKRLELPTVREISIRNANQLESVSMATAEIVNFSGNPILNRMAMPSVRVLSISNTNFTDYNLDLDSMPKLQILRLETIIGLDIHKFICGSFLECINITNCNVLSLSGLEMCRRVVIENCYQLHTIDGLRHVSSLTIDNCSELKAIYNCSDIQKATISKCNKLKAIADVEIDILNIEYCFGITSINSIQAKTLNVSFCPRILNIKVNPDTENLNIESCGILDSIDFICETAFCYSKLKIWISGDNMIENIKEWFVSRLTISDNHVLESIANVYNMKELSLINCHELVSISETFILESLYVVNCASLESISNVYGFSKLDIINCDYISDMDIQYSKLRSLTVQECPLLHIHCSGKLLEELTLVDTGVVTVRDLNETASIHIRDVPLIPNLISKQNRVGHLINEETIKFIKHMGDMIKSAKLISHQLHSLYLRKKYRKFISMKESNRLVDCVICQEEITVGSAVFTQCDHMYHADCLNQWTRTRRVCPLCNHQL